MKPVVNIVSVYQQVCLAALSAPPLYQDFVTHLNLQEIILSLS